MNTTPAIPVPPDTAAHDLEPESESPARRSHPVLQLGFAYGLTFAVVAALAWLV